MASVATLEHVPADIKEHLVDTVAAASMAATTAFKHVQAEIEEQTVDTVVAEFNSAFTKFERVQAEIEADLVWINTLQLKARTSSSAKLNSTVDKVTATEAGNGITITDSSTSKGDFTDDEKCSSFADSNTMVTEEANVVHFSAWIEPTHADNTSFVKSLKVFESCLEEAQTTLESVYGKLCEIITLLHGNGQVLDNCRSEKVDKAACSKMIEACVKAVRIISTISSDLNQFDAESAFASIKKQYMAVELSSQRLSQPNEIRNRMLTYDCFNKEAISGS